MLDPRITGQALQRARARQRRRRAQQRQRPAQQRQRPALRRRGPALQQREPALRQRALRREQRLLLFDRKRSGKQPAEQPGERNISFDFPLSTVIETHTRDRSGTCDPADARNSSKSAKENHNLLNFFNCVAQPLSCHNKSGATALPIRLATGLDRGASTRPIRPCVRPFPTGSDALPDGRRHCFGSMNSPGRLPGRSLP